MLSLSPEIFISRPMSKIAKNTFIGLTIIYLLLHLATLSLSPLPWFDEVSFASIANSFRKAGTLYQEAISVNTVGENSMYGPIYFAVQALVLRMAGWSIFAFRFTNFLFGIVNLLLMYRIALQLKLSSKTAILLVALIALEPAYNQILHSGRMDYLAMTFVFSAIWQHLVSREKNTNGIANGLWVGALLSAAMLTTPRTLFAFSFFVVVGLYDVLTTQGRIRSQLLVRYVSIAVSASVLYLLWIYLKFGGMEQYVYKNYTSNQIMKDHIGFKLSEMRVNYKTLCYAAWAVAMGVLVYVRGIKNMLPMLLFSVPIVGSFVVLVSGALEGWYFPMISPFLFLPIVYLVAEVWTARTGAYMIVAGCVLLGVVFILKNAYIYKTYDQRDPGLNEEVVMKYIKPGSTVAADFMYYYMAMHNNCTFQALAENGPLMKLGQYYASHKYDYFIFNKANRDLEFFENVSLKGRYRLIGTYDNHAPINAFSKLFDKLGLRVTQDYSCYIFQYVSEDYGAQKIFSK